MKVGLAVEVVSQPPGGAQVALGSALKGIQSFVYDASIRLTDEVF